MIGPEFEGHSKNKQYTAGADFYKVDVDANPDISEEVGIRAVSIFPAGLVVAALDAKVRCPLSLFSRME